MAYRRRYNTYRTRSRYGRSRYGRRSYGHRSSFTRGRRAPLRRHYYLQGRRY